MNYSSDDFIFFCLKTKAKKRGKQSLVNFTEKKGKKNIYFQLNPESARRRATLCDSAERRPTERDKDYNGAERRRGILGGKT